MNGIVHVGDWKLEKEYEKGVERMEDGEIHVKNK